MTSGSWPGSLFIVHLGWRPTLTKFQMKALKYIYVLSIVKNVDGVWLVLMLLKDQKMKPKCPRSSQSYKFSIYRHTVYIQHECICVSGLWDTTENKTNYKQGIEFKKALEEYLLGIIAWVRFAWIWILGWAFLFMLMKGWVGKACADRPQTIPTLAYY